MASSAVIPPSISARPTTRLDRFNPAWQCTRVGPVSRQEFTQAAMWSTWSKAWSTLSSIRTSRELCSSWWTE